MCRRLSERQPTFWYCDDLDFHLFVEEGVFIVPKNFPSHDLKDRVWTLVDSDNHPEGVPPRLIDNRTMHIIVFTSSPLSRRWKALSKSTMHFVFYMNSWSKREILKALVHLLPPFSELIVYLV